MGTNHLELDSDLASRTTTPAVGTKTLGVRIGKSGENNRRSGVRTKLNRHEKLAVVGGGEQTNC